MTVLLNNQSCYSILSSSLRIESMIEFAKNHGFKAMGICDERNLFAAMNFYNACQKENIKPIIGIKSDVIIDEKTFSYLIFAKNNTGYKELMQLSTLLCSTKESLTYEELKNISDDCYIISDSDNSYPYYLCNNDQQLLDQYLEYIFTKNNWLIGLGSNRSGFNRQKNIILNERLNNHKDKKIALECAKFADRSYYEATKVLLAIKNGTTIKDDRLSLYPDAYLKSAEELMEYFDVDSLVNTDKLAETIHIDLTQFKTEMPDFKINGVSDTKQYFTQLANAGLKKRLGNNVPQIYQQRLNYELSIINRMGFDQYFLIVYDFIRSARKMGIYIGPGRGSAVASLVSYCLGITHLDPIHYGLVFERFLNPERISMPDIDIDIPDNRREDVIQYVKEKYGFEHIAHIITFGTLQTKAVIRDVGKALEVNSNIMDIISKSISKVDNESLNDVYSNNNAFAKAIDSYDITKKLFDIALKLQGIPRNISTHAAGIVMSKKKLTDVIPLALVSGQYATQYTMEHLEKMGLIKMDFLGLRNLSTIDEIVKSVDPKMNILNIPLDDKATYQLLSKADTSGVFQLESTGMRRTLFNIHPTCFEDIAAAISLYRPGPMQNIPLYLENRKNPYQIQYIDSSLINILKPTYGVIVYQEQILQLAQKVAGFSLGKADILRKAISKKKVAEMEKLKEDFISGSLQNGYKKDVAEKIYSDIYRFSEYGFNKSHACGYSLLAYQLAYLKANYPLHFYVSLLNANLGNSEKTNEFITEIRRKGIHIQSVDIHKSSIQFILENDSIRFPLTAIKNVSNMNANAIKKDIENNGEYKSYFDFLARAQLLKLNDKAIDALIRSGALDCLGYSHTTLLEGKKSALEYIKLCTIKKGDQISFDFDIVSEPVLLNYKDNRNEVLEDQMNFLGLYLNGHPVMEYRNQYKDCIPTYKTNKILGDVTMLLMIQTIKEITTKKTKEKMAFISASDEFGEVELALMPKIYPQWISKLRKGMIVVINGRKDERESIVIKNITIIRG